MGVFFLGFFVPQANSRGGFIGFLASLFLQVWIFLGAQITKKQMRSERLPLSVANCLIPVNITRSITTLIKLDFEKLMLFFNVYLFS
jgi:Na+/proline symporter